MNITSTALKGSVVEVRLIGCKTRRQEAYKCLHLNIQHKTRTTPQHQRLEGGLFMLK